MNPRNWTLNYLFARVRLAWYERQNPEAPWLTAESIAFLDSWLTEQDTVLEFGSGRSTVWLAKRCRFIHSVEHDEGWFQLTSKKLSSFENVDYRHAPLESPSAKDSNYLRVLDEIEDNSCDLLLNDGKLRASVALKAISRIRPGGLHVLDNAERYLPSDMNLPASRKPTEPTDDWAQFISATANWRRWWTSNGVTSTLLMFKPC